MRNCTHCARSRKTEEEKGEMRAISECESVLLDALPLPAVFSLLQVLAQLPGQVGAAPQKYIFNQCSGSESVSFRVFRIRIWIQILPSTRKKLKKNLDFNSVVNF
jgi:hypothetical protein